MATLVLLLVLLWIEPVVSQAHDNDANAFIGTFCGCNPVTSLPNFIKNRNTTFDDLRMQLLSKRVLYARAHAIDAEDPEEEEDRFTTPNILRPSISRCDATPKTSNFYVATTRQTISPNGTVFETAQWHSSKQIAIVTVPFGGVVLCFLILVLWLAYLLRKKSKNIKQGNSDLNGAAHCNYNELKLATKNFSQENILGKGGYGEVFKAVLEDKKVVAVKKLQVQHARVKEEFENEVKLMSNIQHRNLLRLLGWSSEGSNLLLVLEYMQNGSLDRFLWGPKKGTLNWNQRYEIIFGIARGLAHLHDEYHVKIVHRDIKSNNILLGDDFRPKIADFGLARFHPEGQSHVSTGFVGTLGYTAPEYVLHGILSEEVDTYSFGIVVLEIISGRRNVEVKSYGSSAYCLLEDLNEYEQEQVKNIIVIALLCTQSPASNRPTMSEVVSMLQEGRSLGKRQLTKPTFQMIKDRRIAKIPQRT
ncbi:hypothetical protein E3N88_12264 [Mikania micrantha]|uniref:non-specific serine/threonine protein kinase n=1 Tax=Mikania micrantha TaxID=192012 RepID=A0A5N6P7Z3_9ASTR|nr:hypothetical protein E3N88_12264 [Mikania micrantha]